MYTAVPTQNTCAQGWVAAASALIASGGEAYNVIIDVEEPTFHTEADHAVISLLDQFLRQHDANPIITVANTIFPQSLYEAHGSPDLYEIYHRDFDRLSTTKQWGRYFERMTRHRTMDGVQYNPLQELIEKIAQQEEKGKRYSSAYELAIYDPLYDRRVFRGGQCLSFISFKLDASRRLRLTALYRNHHYITRCLGNLIGLGRLQAFVANEASVGVGSLTCISTHAQLDADGWGVVRARDVVQRAAKILEGDSGGA